MPGGRDFQPDPLTPSSTNSTETKSTDDTTMKDGDTTPSDMQTVTGGDNSTANNVNSNILLSETSRGIIFLNFPFYF